MALASPVSYRFPEGVRGWLRPIEGQALEAWAQDAQVLEIGSFVGLSALCMARTARTVTTLDHHQGDVGTWREGQPASSYEELQANIRRHDAEQIVVPLCGPAEELLPGFEPGHFDLIYLDSAHDEESVRRHLELALPLLAPGGSVALHDWDYPSVRAGTQGLLPEEPAEVVGCLARFFPEGKRRAPTPRPAPAPSPPPATNPRVFIGLPHYGDMAVAAFEGLALASAEHPHTVRGKGGSLLALGFNRLVCECLNTQAEQHWTHFALHHADIQAPPGWVDVMVAEMDRVGADVLSVIVPIKDGRGLTSTGFMEPGGRIRRLTMHEVMKLPVTFDAAWGRPDELLMVNTGLLLLRADQSWFERVCFTIRDEVRKDPDGLWRARAMPEDWGFSYWAQKEGLRVWATRIVAVQHHGRSCFGNSSAWGSYQTDEGDKE